jgi:phosphohistidine swiveling domain-containing protein
MEFTWEDGNIFVLQTRDAHLSPLSKLRFLVREYLADSISGKDVFKRLTKDQVDALLTLEEVVLDAESTPLTQGTSLSTGITSGVIVRNEKEMELFGGMEYILCKENLDTQDIALIHKASGIITSAQNTYTHATVIARSLGKTMLTGCDMSLKWNDRVQLGTKYLRSGDIITVDGNTQRVYEGRLQTQKGKESKEIQILCEIAKNILPRKPILYEVQCLEDLIHITDSESLILYSIDFDCARFSGALQESRLPLQELELRALEVNRLLDRRGILRITGAYDAFMPHPEKTKKEYLRMFPEDFPYFKGDDMSAFHIIKPWAYTESFISLALEEFYEP